MIMSWHRVQHTPSTAYTEYSIHWVQHQRNIVCLLFIHISTSWSLNVASAPGVPPYTIDHDQTNCTWGLKCKFTLSQSHGCELPTWWRECQNLPCHPATACKYSSRLTQLRSSSSHDHGLLVHLQTRSSAASKLARSWPPSISPNSLEYGVQVHLQTRLITASKLLDHHLQLQYLQTRLITASKCISKLAQSRSPSVSPTSLDHGLGVCHWVHSMVSFRRTLNCSQAPPAASSDILCRWIAI